MNTILITGATGSFGTAMTEYLLSKPGPKIRVFSRDEHKHERLRQRHGGDPRVTHIVGDVRDRRRLADACHGADAVIHAAALKVVGYGEAHFKEFAMTNIGGSENVIGAALECDVPRTLLISTDKAVEPINGYGLTKAAAERLFVEANQRGASRRCHFSIVRGGNVWNTAGSVSEAWREQALGRIDQGQDVEITDAQATRFHLALPEWTRFVEAALDDMHGGEIFVPKCRAWRLSELALAFGAGSSAHVGLRPGEKMHERLVAKAERDRTLDIGWAYVVEPPTLLCEVWGYRPHRGEPVGPDFDYTSRLAERVPFGELQELARES